MVGRALRRWPSTRDELTACRSSTCRRSASPPSRSGYKGGAIVRRAIIRKEAAEEQDGTPDPIARMISAIRS